jgi:hypothetical protein
MGYYKVKFDWSLLDRVRIIEYLQLIELEVVKTPLTIAQFHNKITGHIKKQLPVRVRKVFNSKVKNNCLHIGGLYNSEFDREKKKCIEIIFEYQNQSSELVLSHQKFQRICYAIADTILHEIIHMRQYRRRKFKVIPDYDSNASKTKLRIEQSYLGNSDEIDAYGFNIACELTDKFGRNRRRIVSYLNENQSNKRRKHNCWIMYLRAFEHNHNHPIIQRVKKKAVRYLTAASYGKPYRNKDWISR